MPYSKCTFQQIHLQLFYDSIESHTRSLSSLGKTREIYGSLLVPIILNKLPADVRKSLARQHGSDIWTIDELQGALLNEIRILEMGSNYLLKGQPNSPQFTAAFHANSARKIPTTTSGAQTPKKPTCVYCKSPHASGTCEVIKDHQKRLDMIKQEKLCFNCLGHHKVSISNCNSRYIGVVNVAVNITQAFVMVPQLTIPHPLPSHQPLQRRP